MTKLLVVWDKDKGDAVPEGKIDDYVIDAVNRAKKCRTGADFETVFIGCLALFNRFRLSSVLDDISEDRIIYLVNEIEYQTKNTKLPIDFPIEVGKKFDDDLNTLLFVNVK